MLQSPIDQRFQEFEIVWCDREEGMRERRKEGRKSVLSRSSQFSTRE